MLQESLEPTRKKLEARGEVSVVVEQMEGLGNEIAALRENINILSNKLQYVLQVPTCKDEDCCDEEPLSLSIPLANDLRLYKNQVLSLTEIVRSLINRLGI